MTQWKIQYRGRDDIDEETVDCDEFVDNGEWVDFVAGQTGGHQEKILRVRASDVVEIRAVERG